MVPGDPYIQRWQIYVTLVLVFSSITTPYRISFTESDNLTWIVINYWVDCTFGIDILLTFFLAYEDENEDLIHDRGIIAKSYLKSWFACDLVSILPVD